MQPPERIAIITNCARRLAAGRDWSDIDFILDQFNLPTTDQWGGGPDENHKFQYIREMLGMKQVADADLRALDDFLAGDPEADPNDQPWHSAEFRVFLTHLAQHKAYATELKLALAMYGVDAFVAHEDIEPGAEWMRQIIAALHSCDALVGILHDKFGESAWCDQEVGIVLGRGKPVIPLRVDVLPHGFFGMVQAVVGTGRPTRQVAREIMDIVIRDKRTGPRAINAVVSALVDSRSFDQSNLLAKLLAVHRNEVDRDQLARLRQAQKENHQVANGFDVEEALSQIEAVLPPPVPAAAAYGYGYDEEPF